MITLDGKPMAKIYNYIARSEETVKERREHINFKTFLAERFCGRNWN